MVYEFGSCDWCSFVCSSDLNKARLTYCFRGSGKVTLPGGAGGGSLVGGAANPAEGADIVAGGGIDP